MTHIRAVNFHINGLPILIIDEMTDKERIDELVVSYDKLKKEISKVK